jgi:sRNA-binding protein
MDQSWSTLIASLTAKAKAQKKRKQEEKKKRKESKAAKKEKKAKLGPKLFDGRTLSEPDGVPGTSTAAAASCGTAEAVNIVDASKFVVLESVGSSSVVKQAARYCRLCDLVCFG